MTREVLHFAERERRAKGCGRRPDHEPEQYRRIEARKKEEEMYRKTFHRGFAALALVTALLLAGAQPAAAMDRSDRRIMGRLANLWSAVTETPVAFWGTLIDWLGHTEEPSSSVEKQTNGSDPNGAPAPTALLAPTDPTVGSW